MMFKQSRVRARRVKKVIKAILTNPPDDMEIKEEMLADYKFIEDKLFRYDIEFIDVLGDNHSFEFHNNVDQFEELEVKYIKAPKEALKQL